MASRRRTARLAPSRGTQHERAAPDGTEMDGNEQGANNRPWWRSPKAALTAACGSPLSAPVASVRCSPAIGPWAFIAAMLVGLVPIARRAVMAALAGTPFSIEMLMTIAAVGAVIIGAARGSRDGRVPVPGRRTARRCRGRPARASIQALDRSGAEDGACSKPTGGTRRSAGRQPRGRRTSSWCGRATVSRPTAIIVAGESAIDEAPVTGESMPVRKGVDDAVFAGTINGDAALRVRVTAAAADNTIARVVRLVEEAQESKAPTERFIDRFSRYYTPGVVVVAALVAIVPPLLFGGSRGTSGSTRALPSC